MNCPKLHKLHNDPTPLPYAPKFPKAPYQPSSGTANVTKCEEDEADGVWAVCDVEEVSESQYVKELPFIGDLVDDDDSNNKEDLKGEF